MSQRVADDAEVAGGHGVVQIVPDATRQGKCYIAAMRIFSTWSVDETWPFFGSTGRYRRFG